MKEMRREGWKEEREWMTVKKGKQKGGGEEGRKLLWSRKLRKRRKTDEKKDEKKERKCKRMKRREKEGEEDRENNG